MTDLTKPGIGGGDGAADLPKLSGRERDCLTHAAQGLSTKRIAARLGVAEPTVNLHLDNARRKIGAANRVETAARAVALGLIAL